MKKYMLIALLAIVSFVVNAQDQMDVSNIPNWTPNASESMPLENRLKVGTPPAKGVGRIFYSPIIKDAKGRLVIQDMSHISVAVMRQIGKDQYQKEMIRAEALSGLDPISQDEYIKFFLGVIEPDGTLTPTRNGQWVKGNNGIQLFRYSDTGNNPAPITILVHMGYSNTGKGYDSRVSPWSDILYKVQI